MGFFDVFRKLTGPSSSQYQDRQLATLCYRIAYQILPPFVEMDLRKAMELWLESPPKAGPFLYVMGCELLKLEPDRSLAAQFRSHVVKLNEEQDCYVLEYPMPAPFSFSEKELIGLAQKSRESVPVLAPYFSALVHRRSGDQVRCFVLGQSFSGGTTLRGVDSETNSNLGPGPEPTLEAFISTLRG